MCTVAVTRIRGVSDPADPASATYVEVVGTVRDCKYVDVTLWIDGSESVPVPAVLYTDPTLALDTLRWKAVFTVRSAGRCGEVDVRARAACRTDPACAADFPLPAPATETLSCELPECPLVLSQSATPTGTCADGRQEVILTAELLSYTSASVAWGAGEGGVVPDLTPAAIEPGRRTTVTTRALYCPGDREATLALGGTCDDTVVHFVVDETCLDCLEGVRLRVDGPGGTVWTQAADGTWPPLAGGCLPPGPYTVRVVEPNPGGDGLTFDWGSSPGTVAGPGVLDVSLAVNQPATIAVAVTSAHRRCCPALPGGVTLQGCADCSSRPLLRIEKPDGTIVREQNADFTWPPPPECFPAGAYLARVVSPSPLPAGAVLVWNFDGTVTETTGPASGELQVPADGNVHALSVTFRGCSNGTSVDLLAHVCPGEVSIAIEDSFGRTVDPAACVVPGWYTARARPDGTSGVWTIDGQPEVEGPEAAVRVDAVPSCNGAPTTRVALRVKPCDCPEKTAEATLTLCDSEIFCPVCWLAQVLVLMLATIAGVGIVPYFCPGIFVNWPIVERLTTNGGQYGASVAAAWVAGAQAAGWASGAVATIAVFLMLAPLAYFLWKCLYSRCHGFVLLWQVLFQVGICMLYYAACWHCWVNPLAQNSGVPWNVLPFTALVVVGGIMALVGVILFFVWIALCRPSWCKIFFELQTVGFVGAPITAVQSVLAACVWTTGAWVILNGITWGLALVGFVGTVIGCLINPNRSDLKGPI